MKKLIILFFSFVLILTASDEFTLLPRMTEQTRPFFNEYPNYNGKGVTIFVMDTGVEVSLPGLDKNPDGSVKVVDVYDASRCGDIKWIDADYREIDGVTYLTDNDEIFLKNFSDFNLEDKPVYLGQIKEKTFQNNVAKDMNGNGKENDAWAFITYQQSDEQWAVVMDTDMDGSLEGEKIIHNYHINQEYIMLPWENPLKNHQWMALAVNIYPDREVTNFHFEDGAHGTHVAGIAAGYHLNGDEDVNGLAPAAKVVSIKIGDGKVHGTATVTGAKKRGLEFIRDYMETHDGYGVINISFGIASSNEGFSGIDNIFNQFAINNPRVIVCTSAGNEGPGLSSIGTPSAAQHIIASGALMYHKTARDKYGWPMKSPKVLQFSSRGGETTKPDVISPGAELSTVPRWERNDFYWGTSMASPYTAGELAAVLSGLQQEMPETTISSALVQYGLRVTSTPLEDYTYLDQGNGMVNMLKLFKWLKAESEKQPPLHYQVNTETFTPSLPLEKSNSVYWRIADIDDVPGEVSVDIKPVFNEKTLQKEIDGFFAKYKIKSDARWAKPLQRKISLLRDIGETIKLKLDTDNFEENECRVAKVSLVPDGKYQNIGQEFFVTAINPIRFENRGRRAFEHESITPGHQNRYFLSIPYGASAMTISVNSPRDEYAKLRLYLLDNHGLPAARIAPVISDDDRFEVEKRITNLEQGVYEFVVLGDLSGKDESVYNMEIAVDGIQFTGESEKTLMFNNSPSFSGSFVPVLDTYNHTKIYGTVSGYAKTVNVNFGKTDTIRHTFSKHKSDQSVAFEIAMPLKYHTNFTDIMIAAVTPAGEEIRMSGIGPKDNLFRLPKSMESGTYTLKILPAYADYAKKEKFSLEMREIHYFQQSYSGSDAVPHNTLFQSEAYDYRIHLSDVPPLIPDGFFYEGEVTILQRGKILARKRVALKK